MVKKTNSKQETISRNVENSETDDNDNVRVLFSPTKNEEIELNSL